MASVPETTRTIRFRASYWMLRFGLWLMPPGRAKSELTALLWTWNMKIQATLAAARAREANHG